MTAFNFNQTEGRRGAILKRLLDPADRWGKDDWRGDNTEENLDQQIEWLEEIADLDPRGP